MSQKKSISNILSKIGQRPGVLIGSVAVLLVGLIVGVMFFIPKGERIDSNGYQVVYMTSGQAYFGKLQNISGDFMTIKDPYTAQDLAPDGEAKPDSGQQSTTLLKVSQQQYGPTDVLSVKSDQVLFWQNLRSDSKVVKAIEDSK